MNEARISELLGSKNEAQRINIQHLFTSPDKYPQ